MKKLILLAVLLLSAQIYSQVTIEYSSGEAETITGTGSYTLKVYSESKGNSILNNSPKIADIPKGDKFYILEDLGNEYLISYNNQVGYVLASSVIIDGKFYQNKELEDKGLEDKEYGYVNRPLNLYKESMSYGFDNVSKQLSKLYKGDKVYILDKVGKEYKVSYNGQIGYLEISGIQDGKEYDNQKKQSRLAIEAEGRKIKEEAEERRLKAERKAREERIALSKFPLGKVEVKSSSPNSAGGVDVTFTYLNTSKKTIKYLHWTGHHFNAVNDPVMCTINRTSISRGKDTGPVEPWQEGGGIWSALIYNYSAREIKISRIRIEYIDGTARTIIGKELMNIGLSKDQIK